ncbi:MAG TPA: 50S ribosomal protein L23 [Clostridiales bacterium]|jgi:large subunit ribosomal protein L23|nr:50S ribosomal protein L23 [Clostridiales bacterium]
MKTPYDILLKPVISERSMDDAVDKKYTFKVATTANKTEIKAAVEEAFGVEVVKVNVMNNEGKLKRQGRYVGRTPSYKKAIVTLSEKSKAIEFFEGL